MSEKNICFIPWNNYLSRIYVDQSKLALLQKYKSKPKLNIFEIISTLPIFLKEKNH